MRTYRMESGLDTGMFSVHQLQPEIALRLALSGILGGLGAHDRSLQTMITKYDTGLVVVGATVDYTGEFTFFSASSVVTEVTTRVRDDGNLIVFDIRHLVGDAAPVTVHVGARPIRLTGGPALDAAPAPFDDEVRALFDADETVARDQAPTRRLQAAIAGLLADAELFAEGEQELFIGRSDCEFADQWLGGRLPGFVATARERLLFDGNPALSVCVDRPLVGFRAEFFRPMFFGDVGRVHVSAYRTAGQTTVVHRVLGPLMPGSGERALCALAVEVFAG